MDALSLKPATSLTKHAKTPFSGASAEYRKAREALLAEEGGRGISVNWQPARSVVGPGEPKDQNSGYVVVRETETE